MLEFKIRNTQKKYENAKRHKSISNHFASMANIAKAIHQCMHDCTYMYVVSKHHLIFEVFTVVFYTLPGIIN